MKKSTLFSILFAAVLLAAACRQGAAEQSTTASEPAQDTAVQQAVIAPVDSLATELDAAADEIEQDAKSLEAALDSL